MLNKKGKLIVIFLLSFSQLVFAQSRLEKKQEQSKIQSQPTQCVSWTNDLSYDLALTKYFDEVSRASETRDFGCLEHYAWVVEEHLFSQKQQGLYHSRLQKLKSEYGIKDSTTYEGYTILADLLQYRWLIESYDRLYKYNSKHIVYGATGIGGLSALAAVIAFKKSGREYFFDSSQLIFRRLMSYTAAYLISKEVIPTLKNKPMIAHKSHADEYLRLEPPLDLLSDEKLYLNYTDKEFLKDIIVLSFDEAVFFTSAAGLAWGVQWSSKYAARFARGAKAVLSPSWIGFIGGYYLSEKASDYLDEKLTEKHREHYQEKLETHLAEIKQTTLNDWQLLQKSREVVSDAIALVSVSDLKLRQEALRLIERHAFHRVCSRLMQRAPSEPELAHWPRRELSSDIFSLPNVEEKAEQRLKARIKETVDEEKEVLIDLIKKLDDISNQLAESQKLHLKTALIQINGLKLRLQQDLDVNNEHIETHLQDVRNILRQLKTGSEVWLDHAQLVAIQKKMSCP